MKVKNMTSSNGNVIANQFIIEDVPQDRTKEGFILEEGEMFQSYKSIIAHISYDTKKVFLDQRYWDYSVTTGKYRNIFLGETKKETQRKIDSGVYTLCDLN